MNDYSRRVLLLLSFLVVMTAALTFNRLLVNAEVNLINYQYLTSDHTASQLLEQLKDSSLNCAASAALARTYQGEGSVVKAQEYYLQALLMDCQLPIVSLRLGEILYETGQEDLAINLWKEVDAEKLFYHRGLALWDSKRVDEAEGAFRIAVQIAPQWADPHRGLAYILWEKVLIDEAFDTFLLAAERYTDCVDKYLMLGEAHRVKREWALAARDFEHAAQCDENAYLPLVRAGDSYKSLGDWRIAQDLYFRALRLQPGSVEVLLNLGDTYRIGKHFDEAYEIFQKVQDIRPQSAIGFRYAGRNAVDAGDLENALRLYHEALERDPHNQATLYELGVLYSDLERYDEALTYLRTAIRVASPKSWILSALGSVYEEQKRFNLAIKYYERSLQLYAEDPQIRRRLRELRHIHEDQLNSYGQ